MTQMLPNEPQMTQMIKPQMTQMVCWIVVSVNPHRAAGRYETYSVINLSG